jgi:hypothetical protein
LSAVVACFAEAAAKAAREQPALPEELQLHSECIERPMSSSASCRKEQAGSLCSAETAARSAPGHNVFYVTELLQLRTSEEEPIKKLRKKQKSVDALMLF